MAWVCLTVPLAALAGVFLRGERQYLIGWVLASGLYTTPALVISWLVWRRAPRADRSFWWLMLAGLVFIYATGLAVLVLELSGWDRLRGGGAVAVCVAILAYGVGHVLLLRSRSGHLAVSLDMVEIGISAVAIISTVPLLVGESVVRAEAAWFAVPSALATMAMITGSLWLLQLLVRLGDERTPMEVMGATLAFVGAVQASLQVAEGVTGFDLPQGPVIGLQCVCMGLVLLIPLHASHRSPLGLDRLPPQAQVRDGRVVALITLTAMVVLLIETAVLAGSTSWAVPYAAAVATSLLVLSTARHLLTLQETKRLYAEVEKAAEDRRLLLAQVMHGADHDRHRVAAQLHEQAVSSYAAFVSFIHSTCHARDGVSPQVAGASARVRDDLSRQAESLRQLMLAVQPIEASTSATSDRLRAPITAYIDSLYGDTATPVLMIDVGDDLVLDYNTETIVLRIVQEAVRNVWCHSRAKHLRIAVLLVDDQVDVRVEDDGVGFDPGDLLFESGLATIRSFAGFTGGEVHVESHRGGGTSVVARLGGGPSFDAFPSADLGNAATAADGHDLGPRDDDRDLLPRPDRSAATEPHRRGRRPIAGGPSDDRTAGPSLKLIRGGAPVGPDAHTGSPVEV